MWGLPTPWVLRRSVVASGLIGFGFLHTTMTTEIGVPRPSRDVIEMMMLFHPSPSNLCLVVCGETRDLAHPLPIHAASNCH